MRARSVRHLIHTVLFLCLANSGLALAHESRPAYLEITESQPEVFDITWRRPARGEMVLSMQPVFPKHCEVQGNIANYLSSGAHVARWTLQCSGAGLVGHTIYVEGLVQTITDVLVRIQFLDGITTTQIVKPNNAKLTVTGAASTWKVISDYFVLGVEHILGGIDHLLFVLCLLLIVKGNWLLVKTITAFTVAHSITLAVATLGLVNVPQAPVEAVIALSILFLAVELVKQQQGKSDLAMRAPWIVAFIFGLLHGFGFAGALSEVGLPQSDIPLALLMFNVGVEVGQLLFITVVIAAILIWKRFSGLQLVWLPRATAYAIGGLSSFWVLSRIAIF
jgi:hydrogenase/urease accessory protein HupE